MITKLKIGKWSNGYLTSQCGLIINANFYKTFFHLHCICFNFTILVKCRQLKDMRIWILVMRHLWPLWLCHRVWRFSKNVDRVNAFDVHPIFHTSSYTNRACKITALFKFHIRWELEVFMSPFIPLAFFYFMENTFQRKKKPN